jgi:membrane protease YdiL (CAAX protease family)
MPRRKLCKSPSRITTQQGEQVSALVTPQSATLVERLSQWAPARVICYVAAIVATAVVAKILTHLFVPPSPSPLHTPLTTMRNLLLPIAMFAAYAIVVRLIERRAANELDIRRGLATFLSGLAVGSILMGAVYLVLWLLGMARFSSGAGFEGLTAAVMFNLATAMGEELLFRAVLFRIAEQVAGTTVAIVMSAAIFGILHAANPGATAFGIGALTIEFGIMLALAYVLTRNIWLAVGIHMAWNFTQGYVFGVEVSGASQPYSILKTSVSGPDLLTGGSFGPEGSIVALGISVVASAVLAVLILRKRGWQPLRFRLRLPTGHHHGASAVPSHSAYASKAASGNSPS